MTFARSTNRSELEAATLAPARGSRTRIPIFLRSALLALMLVVGYRGPAPALAAEPTGYDISSPNCGQPLPSGRPSVTIVGVEGGRSFTQNPCLDQQFQWANATGQRYQVYINTSYPAGSTSHRGDTGPKGTCGADDLSCKAYNYGFNNAEYALQYAQSRGAVADTWWLDVETANSWSDNPDLNDQVIQGAVDSLRAHRLLVGIYSIPSMWQQIAGNFTIKLPVWVVQIYQSVAAGQYCSTANGFGGGAAALVQVEGSGLDQDVSCPGDAFAEQPTYVPFPLNGSQSGQLNGRHGGISTFYALPASPAGQIQAITVDLTPAGADVTNAVFVTVSQGDQVLAQAQGSQTPTPGELRLTFTPSGTNPIIARIQNFNFENLPPVSYTIRLG